MIKIISFPLTYIQKSSLLLLSIIFALHFNSTAQNRNWTETNSKDDRVAVKYEIIGQKEGQGGKRKVVHYIAKITAAFDLEKAEAFMRNTENYPKFLEHATKSREVKKVSQNEWISYLYFDPPWPMSDFDCVQRFTFKKSSPNEFTITAIVDAQAYELQGVKRMNLYDASYHFQKINETQSQLTLAVSFSPTGNVPKWMLKAWFPKGPSDIVKGVVDQLK